MSLGNFGGFLDLLAVLASGMVYEVAWIYKVEAKIQNSFYTHMLRS